MSNNAAIDSTITAAWPLPLAVVIVVYALLLALVVLIYLTERGTSGRHTRIALIALRFSLLVLVVWMLLGWTWHRVRTELPELVVAIDISDSMRTADTESIQGDRGQPTRLDRVRQLLSLNERQLGQLRDRYRWRIYTLADGARRMTTDAAWNTADLESAMQAAIDAGQNTHVSRLGDAVSDIVERQTGRGTAAIVFVSDGINTAGETLADAAQLARSSAIPVHTITIGSQLAQPDLRMTDLLYEKQVYLGDRVAISASLLATDLPMGQTVIKLIEADSGRTLDQQSASINNQTPQQPISLNFTPDRPGELKLQVVIDAVPGETNLSNNQAEFSVLVQDRVIRVLMVFGQPSFEFRFLKHFLERSVESGSGHSTSFELKSVLQSGDLDYVTQDQSALRFLPSSPTELELFDVFIFGNLDPQIIPRSVAQSIHKAVTHGGAGCVFIGDNVELLRQLNRSPLNDLLPFESPLRTDRQHRYQPAATKLGANILPWQALMETSAGASGITSLPPLESVLLIDRLKPSAQVIADAITPDGQTTPLLISQFAGAGRTVCLTTDETYRWSSANGSDQAHQLFWGQLLRWLSRGKLNSEDSPELLAEPKQTRIGTPVRLSLRLPVSADLPDAAEVRISHADGASSLATMTRIQGSSNRYQATLQQLTAGAYHAVVSQPIMQEPATADFVVTTEPGDQANLRADFKAMAELAQVSRGKSYVASDGDRWFDELPPGQPSKLGSLPPKPIWNSWWVALAFTLLITCEWLLRRRARML